MKMSNALKDPRNKAIIGTIIGALLSAISVVWIMDLGDFFATGTTGIAQIFNKLFNRDNKLPMLEGLIFFALNIPLIVIGAKGVSKRFAIYSALSVVLQSSLFVLFRYINFNPFKVFIAEGTESRLMLAILGGLVGGVSSGITLRMGSSTGGIEIISQYFFFKKQKNFAGVSFVLDFFILIGAYFAQGRDFECICYTLVRLIIYLIVVDKMHTIYKNVMIKVVTDKGEEVKNALIAKFNHGITMYKAVGGYSKGTKDVLEIAMSSYEINEYRNIIRSVDKDAFITSYQITKIDGFFNHNIMG